MNDVMEQIKTLSATLDEETARFHPTGRLLLLGSYESVFLKAVKRKADLLLPPIYYHSKTMPDYYDKPPVSNHNKLHSSKTAGRQLVIFRKTMPRSEISNSS